MPELECGSHFRNQLAQRSILSAFFLPGFENVLAQAYSCFLFFVHSAEGFGEIILEPFSAAVFIVDAERSFQSS